jgi:hypothetical protein
VAIHRRRADSHDRETVRPPEDGSRARQRNAMPETPAITWRRRVPEPAVDRELICGNIWPLETS